MAIAVTLCLDAASAAHIDDMCKVLAVRGITDYAARLGYRPHVTLMRGDDIEMAATLLALRDFASKLERLVVCLDAISVFSGDTSVLWLALADNPALREVQATLHRALAPLLNGETYSTPVSWIPHVTLAEGLRAEALAAAVDALRPTFKPLNAGLDRLELVHFPPVRVEWGIAIPAKPPRSASFVGPLRSPVIS